MAATVCFLHKARTVWGNLALAIDLFAQQLSWHSPATCVGFVNRQNAVHFLFKACLIFDSSRWVRELCELLT